MPENGRNQKKMRCAQRVWIVVVVFIAIRCKCILYRSIIKCMAHRVFSFRSNQRFELLLNDTTTKHKIKAIANNDSTSCGVCCGAGWLTGCLLLILFIFPLWILLHEDSFAASRFHSIIIIVIMASWVSYKSQDSRHY